MSAITIPQNVIKSARMTADTFGVARIFKASESVAVNVARSDDWFVRHTGNPSRPVVLAAIVTEDGTVALQHGFRSDAE